MPCNHEYSKTCAECNKDFIARRQSTKFCSAKCNNLNLYKNRNIEAYNLRKRSKSVAKQRKERYHSDIEFRLASIIRARMLAALKDDNKTGSAIDNLGCSVSKFKTYLESKFQLGMSWDNHSRYGWHMDHIVPLTGFNLSDLEQFKKACHYTNIQPLWWRDNIVKGGA